jgi:hypothetical protein
MASQVTAHPFHFDLLDELADSIQADEPLGSPLKSS